MQELIEKAWPLLAAAMEDRNLPTRLILDTPGKTVLYRLSHPKPLNGSAIRAGGLLSNAAREAKIRALQEQADKESEIFDLKKPSDNRYISLETRRYLASVSAKKRFLLLDTYKYPAFGKRYLGRTKGLRKPNHSVGQRSVESHRKAWIVEDLFQPLSDLYELWQDLIVLSPAELKDGFTKFGAETEEEAARAAPHPHRAWILATCIAVAKPVPSSAGCFATESSLRSQVAAYFIEFCDARQRASRTTKANAPTKMMILNHFQRNMSTRIIP